MMGRECNKRVARGEIRRATYMDENAAVESLLRNRPLDSEARSDVMDRAQAMVLRSRDMRSEQSLLDAFLHEFGLSNQEGVLLMCLAEALLRIPDIETQDSLIAEKIHSGDWASHLGTADNLMVSAGIWGLVLSGRVVGIDRPARERPLRAINQLVHRLGEPVIRQAVNRAMQLMGKRFVFGRTIEEAQKLQARLPEHARLMSYDMLGEGARTQAAVDRYMSLYLGAIDAVGSGEADTSGGPEEQSSVSIKLSALHPRYEQTKKSRVLDEMLPRLMRLAERAKSCDMQLTIDAEEADRLDLSLCLFERLARAPELAGWQGLGLAIQGYLKRCSPLVDWLVALASETGRQFPVRLVKGAYWDTEIKHAQELGMPDYPVWTRKATTDLSYLVCARKMLEAGDLLYPQFATHNAHTIAAIDAMAAKTGAIFEFQRLHGMGELLYKAASEVLGRRIRPRIYAPVGAHRELLPYLVRRLLENGANSSFIHSFLDKRVEVAEVTKDPISVLESYHPKRNPHIPTPPDIYGESRMNSRGLDLKDPMQLEPLLDKLAAERDRLFDGSSIVRGEAVGGEDVAITSPVDRRRLVGQMRPADADTREAALAAASAAFPDWNRRGGAGRAPLLRAMADALEAHRESLIGLMAREAGKTLDDGIAEVREAVDFCRYYASLAEEQFENPISLPGPTGERNELTLDGRGVFLTISPWNFPLAIFTGQLAAALAAGNTVIAKPAEQTPLVAAEAVRLFHEAGIPADVLQLLQGPGETVAAPLVSDERIAGVAFTGSVDVAKAINRALAARDGAIAPLIAETGGQNAMIVDSTALPEQVTDDIMTSAFASAGQRCSALRILCLQEEVADEMLEMIVGALAERRVGDPADPATDIGPIIDEESRDRLAAHVRKMEENAKIVARGSLPEDHEHGCYLAPHIVEIDSVEQLEGEVFGPVLHVLRYKAEEVETVMSALAATGFGLTFGIHSRLESRWRDLCDRSLAGNVYINRNMIGAVVGVQPFGGRGLSGTGPKAGGPHYLLRFAAERVTTVNTAAIGGNTDLFRIEG